VPAQIPLYLLCYALAVQGRAAEAGGLFETFRQRGGAESGLLVARLWVHISERDWSAINEIVTRLAGESGTLRVLPLQLSLRADLSAGRLRSSQAGSSTLWRAASENRDFNGRHLAGLARAWVEMRLTGGPAVLSDEAVSPADEDLRTFRDFATFSVETNLAEPLRSILKGYEA